MKWLMSLVLPGSEEVLARLFIPISIFMREDFPTFDLPMKANSGCSVTGHNPGSVLLTTNSALFINIGTAIGDFFFSYISSLISYLLSLISYLS
jgi:hypothetical protein